MENILLRAEEEIERRGLKFYGRPAIEESYHAIPLNLPDLQSHELSERMAAMAALANYVSRTLAGNKVRLYAVTSAMKEQQARVCYLKDTGKTKKYEADSEKFTDTLWNTLMFEELRLKAVVDLEQVLFDGYIRAYAVLSRDYERRSQDLKTI